VLVDFRTYDSAGDIDCDICIIGAGAAGITLARSLIDSGIRVCLLESGGLEFSPDIQSLYEGEAAGLENASPIGCRLHYFGGSTNHWKGWCAPLKDIDFEPRSWIPHSGWPIRRADLDPYYEKARDICQIGSLGFKASDFLDDEYHFPPFSPDKADIRFFRFSPPTRFGQVYRERLSKAENVTVFLYANTVLLETNEAATAMRRVRLQTLEGKSGAVGARIFVLACGGMENARLLLLSNKTERDGLGNSSGLVGRYFMQHIEGNVANILATDPGAFAESFKTFKKQGVPTIPEVSTSRRAQEKHGILNSSFTIKKEYHHGAGYESLRDIWHNIKQGSWPSDFSDKLWNVLTDLGSVEKGISKEDISTYLYVRAEQQPNRDSQISLSNKLDKLGLPEIKVNWQLTEFDKYSIREAVYRVAEEFGRLNLGRVRLRDWVMREDNEWPQPLWGGCHHMGTTRMSDDAKMGVVDSNCRMHTVSNLYIAGSSVFPTGGNVTPTFTIVALALRLADHLKQQFHESKTL
jgi:choline dehydrogenase-like flavoprotein